MIYIEKKSTQIKKVLSGKFQLILYHMFYFKPNKKKENKTSDQKYKMHDFIITSLIESPL